jgi:hypothetical protein
MLTGQAEWKEIWGVGEERPRWITAPHRCGAGLSACPAGTPSRHGSISSPVASGAMPGSFIDERSPLTTFIINEGHCISGLPELNTPLWCCSGWREEENELWLGQCH